MIPWASTTRAVQCGSGFEHPEWYPDLQASTVQEDTQNSCEPGGVNFTTNSSSEFTAPWGSFSDFCDFTCGKVHSCKFTANSSSELTEWGGIEDKLGLMLITCFITQFQTPCSIPWARDNDEPARLHGPVAAEIPYARTVRNT